MEIEKLTQQTAVSILQYFLDNKFFDLTDVKEAMAKRPTPEFMRTVDFIHRILCRESHTLESGPTQCGYDGESAFDECWTMPFHKYWMKKAQTLMSELGISNEAQLQSHINRAQPVLSQLAMLEVEEPAAYRLVLLVRGYSDLDQ
jgi:hypothetical protein